MARVIRNTGMDDLTLVAPGDWRTIECWRLAWGAHEVLERAAVAQDLSAAIADCAYVVAFSGHRDGPSPPLDVREIAGEIAGVYPDESVALVFGPETAGLTHHEIAICGRRALIPSHPQQPSLNLSHAVMVAGYEVLRARSRPAPAPRRARHDEKQAMLALLRDGLLQIRALPRQNTDRYFLEWESLFTRADLTPKEVHLLEHMARKMLLAAPRLGENSNG